MSIQSITDSVRKEQADLLDRYIKYEMKRLNLTLDDLKDYELTKEMGEVKYEKDDNGMLVSISQTVRFQLKKKK